jgi:hypothetical protein
MRYICSLAAAPTMEKLSKTLGLHSFDSEKKLSVLSLDFAVVHVGLDSLICQFTWKNSIK